MSFLAHILPNPLCNKCILNCSYLNSIIIIMKFLHFIHCVSAVVRQHLFWGNEANTHGIKFGGQFISVKAVIKMKTEKINELCSCVYLVGLEFYHGWYCSTICAPSPCYHSSALPKHQSFEDSGHQHEEQQRGRGAGVRRGQGELWLVDSGSHDHNTHLWLAQLADWTLCGRFWNPFLAATLDIWQVSCE